MKMMLVAGLFRLISLHSDAGADRGERVSLGDIENRLRSLGTEAQAPLEKWKKNIGATAAAGGIAVVAATFLLGRRRGRKRATVLEIRRV